MNSTIISLRQMRAARGLMNWSQSDLAKKIELSITAINNMDREISSPRLQTLEKIKNTFENHGIEFIEGDGVRICDDIFKVTTYEDEDAFFRYTKDIVETLKLSGGEALSIIKDEKYYIDEHKKTIFNYYKQFEKYHLHERILMCEGTMERYGPPNITKYKWCSKELASQIATTVCENKYCILLPEKIIVIENSAIAEAYTKQFEEHWKRAKAIPKQKSLYEEYLEKLRRKSQII